MTKLEDVAREAGVSTSTVSRVLSRPGMVSAETRARVERTIDRLEFRPSRVARRLRARGGPTNLVGLLIPDIQNPFFADVARGVEDVARGAGYVTMLANSDEDKAIETRFLEVMRSESVDGVILPPVARPSPAEASLHEARIPIVKVDRRPASITGDTVVIDNERGAREATEHLLRLGHRRIGFIEGRPILSTSRDRLEGYRQALGSAGVRYDRELVEEGDSRRSGGERAARALLALDAPPTALLVGNSMMTLGALQAVRALGRRMPDDVAVIGYDDVPWALALDPPLTVVRQPAEAMGRRAMELLLRRVEKPERDVQLVVLQPELVVRRSCGAEPDAVA